MARAVGQTTDVEPTARNVVAACCAASAGVHAALVPEHLREGLPLGSGFAVAAILLFGSTLAFTGSRPAPSLAAPATAALLFALIVAYGLSRTVGLPLIGAEVEAVDGVGVTTQVVQAAALTAAIALTIPASARTARARGKAPRA